jgi:hypothetical protein
MLTKSTNRVLLLIGICWAGLLAAFLLDAGFLKILFGVPATLFFPGLLTVKILGLRLKPLERNSLIGALSLAELIGSVLVASLGPDGISSQSVLTALGGTTAILGVIHACMPRRSAREAAGDRPAAVSTAMHRAGNESPRRRVVGIWAATAITVVGALAGAAWLSVSSEQTASQTDFTRLSLAREGNTNLCKLEVNNLEGSAVVYQLEVSKPGEATSLQSLTLEPQQIFRRDLVVAGPGEVVVRLYGGSSTQGEYRQVKAVMS